MITIDAGDECWVEGSTYLHHEKGKVDALRAPHRQERARSNLIVYNPPPSFLHQVFPLPLSSSN